MLLQEAHMTRLIALALAAFLALTAAISLAQSSAPKSGGGAKESGVASLGFLAGAWRSGDPEAIVEEMWSQPQGTSMMGCFRWLSGAGEARMFEMLTITQEKDGAVRLRLRHYTPTLGAKEDKDKPQTLKLSRASASRAEFEAEKDAGDLQGVVYEVKDGELHIEVLFKITGAEVREPLTFKLKKVAM
jgi:hypothetical protein